MISEGENVGRHMDLIRYIFLLSRNPPSNIIFLTYFIHKPNKTSFTMPDGLIITLSHTPMQPIILWFAHLASFCDNRCVHRQGIRTHTAIIDYKSHGSDRHALVSLLHPTVSPPSYIPCSSIYYDAWHPYDSEKYLFIGHWHMTYFSPKLCSFLEISLKSPKFTCFCLTLQAPKIV